jgi:hypothetical protein
MYNEITFLAIVVILLIGIVSMSLCDSKEADAQSKMTGSGAKMPKNILDIP